MAKPGLKPSTPAHLFYSNSTAHTITSLAAVSSSVIPSSQSRWLGTPLAKRTVHLIIKLLEPPFKDTVPKEGRNKIDPIIGCIILSEPFFFPEEDWIDVSGFWPKNLTQGKTFNTEDEPGRNIWDRMSERITKENVIQNEPNLDLTASAVKDRYGVPYLTRPRLGQGAFGPGHRRLPTPLRHYRRKDPTGIKRFPYQTLLPKRPP